MSGSGRRWVLGILGLLGLLAGCTASPPDPAADAVPGPEWKVGDRWVFRRTDLSAGAAAVVTHQVTAATADGYTLRILGLADEVTRQWTAELHLQEQRVGGRVPSRWEPAARYFDWPLTLGKAWTQEFAYRDGERVGRYRNDWRVAATVEPVHVLAGTFYALRIEHRGGGGERLDTYWYTPRVRYWVRLESYLGGYTEELVEFGSPAS